MADIHGLQGGIDYLVKLMTGSQRRLEEQYRSMQQSWECQVAKSLNQAFCIWQVQSALSVLRASRRLWKTGGLIAA